MKKRISRRKILKMGAAAGAMAFVGGPLTSGLARAGENNGDDALPQVPRRILGKTGETIPILLMGGAMKLNTKFDPKLAEALRFGVDYIDAADCYNNGKCEHAVAGFMDNGNVDRKRLWITSKSDRHDPKGLEKTLDTSLEKMQTDYVDLYFMHALKNEAYINDDMKVMSEKLKKEKKTRFFGFSCHDGNVAALLNKAADVGWIDAIMFRYNFRQYGDKELNDAMDRCVKAGVGLIAMKTQGSAASFADTWKPYEETGKWTQHQAVLKAVWADTRISAAVSHMDTFEKLKQNIAAAVDKYDLGQAEWDSLRNYADATRSHSCDGCDHHCNPAVEGAVQIGATMRYLMYHDSYDEKQKAKELFARLPKEARRLDSYDFEPANRACPHGVNVAAHMRRASKVLNA